MWKEKKKKTLLSARIIENLYIFFSTKNGLNDSLFFKACMIILIDKKKWINNEKKKTTGIYNFCQFDNNKKILYK